MRLPGRCTAAALLLLALAGCISIDHNLPGSSPINAGLPHRLTLFADANGHLYPDAWAAMFDRRRIEEDHSLFSAAGGRADVRDQLDRSRTEQLDAMADQLRDNPRIFILVHGFNNTHAEARHAFDVVRGRLPLRPTDAVVEFHWDGLASPDLPGQGRMWFSAVAYSQMAGAQALRGLLARLPDRHLVVVAHSRGSSVALSALSNPRYSRRFRAATESILDRSISADPLPDGSGPIDLLFFAPAIGRADFWTEHGGGVGPCGEYRDFPRRLRRLHYTVNPDDPILRKFISYFSSRFNATDLGHEEQVGLTLADCYRGRFTMVGQTFYMDAHSFIDYALHESFPRMIAAAGLSGP